MILALSGKSGSGKDIVGKIIQYLTDKDKGGYSHPDSQDDFETYCKNFKQKYCDWKIKKYAGKVKEIASLLTGIPIEMFEDQDFKRKQMSEGWEMTYREFLQKLGTEAMRDGLHTNVWVNALFADYNAGYTISPLDVDNQAPDNWIITDMRFPNEMEAVVEKGGITIRVVRPGTSTGTHPSEIALDGHTMHYEIINDGTIEDLVEKVKEILTKQGII